MGAIYSDVCWSVHNSASVNGQTKAKIMNTFHRGFNIINYKNSNSTKYIYLTMILNNDSVIYLGFYNIFP